MSHNQLLALVIALALASFVLFAMVVWHTVHLNRLRNWLKNPRPQLMPEGYGRWQFVFDTLLRREKSRKKRKKKLRAALHRFNLAANAVPNGVIVLDKDGRMEWMNPPASEHLGLSDKDRGGILVNLLRMPDFHRFMQQPLAHSEPMKITLPGSIGTLPRTLLLTRTAFDKDAQLLTSQDISTIEQLEITRTAFVANVSHELRTPLTVINGFLEAFSAQPDLPVEQQQAFIALMQQEGSRMQSLLADLLTLSRLESRSSDTSPPPRIDLSALCQQIAEACQRLSQGRHSLEIDIEDGIHMQGLEQDMYAALSNIAFNAVRYTQPGGRIRIELHRTNARQATFSVSDTGPGIAAEHLPRLTERFYRVDPARSRQSGGTGLGLAITKHALARHGTTLDIESTPGKGSLFSTRLPVTEHS